MSKQNFDINKLRVASPCSVGWETMSGDARKRFCNLCKLNVYNFSEMTAKEVNELIVKSEGKICGRLYKRADETILTKDCPVGLRAYQRRVSRFAGASLATILGLFSVSFGQKTDEKPTGTTKIKIVRTLNQETILSGTIVDPSGTFIPNAEVTIYKIEGEKLTFKADSQGFYKLHTLLEGIYALEVKATGFVSYKIAEFEVNTDENTSISIILEPEYETLGVVGDMPMIEIEPSNLKIQTEIVPRTLKKPY